MVMAMITTLATITIMAMMTLTTLKAKQKYVFQESDHLQLYFDTTPGQMGRLPPGMWQPSKHEDDEDLGNAEDLCNEDHLGIDDEGEDEEKDEKVALRYILIQN